MLVSTAIPAGASNDPIYEAIDAHKAARAVTLSAVGRMSEFERELQAVDRLQTASRHEGERQRGEEIEAAIEEAFEAEADAACVLLSVRPTTACRHGRFADPRL